MKKYLVLGTLTALAPVMALAADGVEGVLETISKVVSTALPVVLSLAVLFFVWSLAMYMSRSGEEKETAKTNMIWGIVILFVMVSIWGLVGVLTDTFDLKDNNVKPQWEVKGTTKVGG